jgi:hypothetical protein
MECIRIDSDKKKEFFLVTFQDNVTKQVMVFVYSIHIYSILYEDKIFLESFIKSKDLVNSNMSKVKFIIEELVTMKRKTYYIQISKEVPSRHLDEYFSKSVKEEFIKNVVKGDPITWVLFEF